jgi:hypothetical protein
MATLLETPSLLCPGPHAGPDLPPASLEIFGGTAACTACGTSSRICPNASCAGRTRAGGFFCRICGERLPGAWRQEFWAELDRDFELMRPVLRTLPGRETGRLDRVHLTTTDAWIALALDERVMLLEPGPQLALFAEHRMEAGETFVDLRSEEGDRPAWRLLTSQQVLELEPQDRRWRSVERFPPAEGELLWQSRHLRALYRPGTGSSLWSRSPLRKLIAVPGLLSQPAWLPGRRFVCTDDAHIYLGSFEEPGSPTSFRTPEPLSPHAPIFDSKTGRVYVPGEKTLMWWQPGARSFVPFLPSGAGAVLLTPHGVILLEADRLQFFRSDVRRLWDSSTAMSDFARSALHWDRVGNALLVPVALRGAASHILLLDLQRPGRVWRMELKAPLPTEPRLAPGGVVAVQQRAGENLLDLVWIGVGRRSSVAG